MSGEANGGRVAIVIAIATLSVTTILGVGGYLQTTNDLAVKTGELQLAKLQLASGARAGIDPTLKGIGDTQLLLDTATGPEDRGLALRSLARKLRTSSARRDPLPSIRSPLPSGTEETAAFLSDKLKQYPIVIDLSRVDLHQLFWRGSHLNNVQMREADLRDVNFTNASMANVSLQDSALMCADFSNATLTGKVEMDGADLSFTDLRGVNLSAVAGLHKAQLTGADYDDKTVFPPKADLRLLGVPAHHYPGARTCAKVHSTTSSQSAAGLVVATPSPSATAPTDGSPAIPTSSGPTTSEP